MFVLLYDYYAFVFALGTCVDPFTRTNLSHAVELVQEEKSDELFSLHFFHLSLQQFQSTVPQHQWHIGHKET
jgi:hypothetical protein